VEVTVAGEGNDSRERKEWRAAAVLFLPLAAASSYCFGCCSVHGDG